MTENEAIKKIQYRINTASEAVGKGTDGKAFEDLEMAIQALEEIQQYRAIGTVRQVQDFIADWRKYREFGTLEDIQTMKDNGSFSGVELAQIATMQMKLKDYEAIGTVEELQETINFKKYFMNLREEGLEVANWHKNGDLEPLVNFIDEACNWLEMKGEEI